MVGGCNGWYGELNVGAHPYHTRPFVVLSAQLCSFQMTVSLREQGPVKYTNYEDMEKDFVSGKVRRCFDTTKCTLYYSLLCRVVTVLLSYVVGIVFFSFVVPCSSFVTSYSRATVSRVFVCSRLVVVPVLFCFLFFVVFLFFFLSKTGDLSFFSG